MSTSKTWNGTSVSIPAAGERNWPGLSDFLIALADYAQTTRFQKTAIRVATTSPVSVSSSSDHTVVTNLSVAGAVAVSLPAGVTGQQFVIVDGKGDAQTNNITITPNSGQINGSSTYVIGKNRAGVVIAYNGTSWTVVSEFTSESSTSGVIVVKDANFTIQDDSDTTKQVQFQLSGITAGNTRTITVPDASTTMVGTATTQTLTNKNLSSPTNTLDGATVGSFTNTGTITLPTATTTLVGRNTTDTLANKTIDASAPNTFLNIPLTTAVTGTLPVTNGGTGQTSASAAINALVPSQTGNNGKVLGTNATSVSWVTALTNPMTTAGDIIYSSDGSGTPARLAIGTKGKKLRAGSSAPEYSFEGINAVSSANYTVLDNDGYDIIAVSTGASDRTITLPTAADNTGRQLRFLKTDTGAGKVIVDGEGTEAIGGSTTYSLEAQYSAVTMYCTGTGWLVLDERHFPVSFTPTGNNSTNITYTGRKWRVGNVGWYEVLVSFVAPGTNTQNATFTINQPSGETIDTTPPTGLLNTTTGTYQLGTCSIYDNTGAAQAMGTVNYESTTTVKLNVLLSSGTYATGTPVQTAGGVPITWATSDQIHIQWSAPIVEFK